MKRFALAILIALIPTLAYAEPDWGTFPDGGTLYFLTNTVGTDGVAETPAAEAIAVYKDGSDTQLTTGAAIDDDVDSTTGLHRISIDTTQSGFDAGSQYTVTYTAGTVDSVSITGRVIGSFKLTDSLHTLGAEFNRKGGRIWYASPATGSSANPGTKSRPLDTLANAYSAASNGDDIVLLDNAALGSGDVGFTVAKSIHLRGINRDVTISGTVAISNTPPTLVELGGSGITISDITITNAGSGAGLRGGGTHAGGTDVNDLLIERVTISADVDGLKIDNTSSGRGGLVATDLHVTGKFDGAVIADMRHVYLDRCYFKTDCTYTGGNTTDNYALKLEGSQLRTVVGLRNSFFQASINATPTIDSGHELYALAATAGAVAKAEGCLLWAQNLYSSSTSTMYGSYVSSSGTASPGLLAMSDCTIVKTSSGGTPTFYNAYTSGTIARVRGLKVAMDEAESNSGDVRFTDKDTADVLVDTAAMQPLVASGLTGHTPQTGDSYARLGAPAGASLAADVAAIESQTDDIGTAGAGLTAITSIASPAQVHNQDPVPSRTAKLGTRADGVTAAYPTIRIRPGEKSQVWIDCSKLVNANLASVASGASSSAELDVDSIGVFGKYVSIVLDGTDFDDADTATITCDVTPAGSQVIKASMSVIGDAN